MVIIQYINFYVNQIKLYNLLLLLYLPYIILLKEGAIMYIDYEEQFIKRLIMLREQKGISARNMSLSIGQNANYINQIESKKTFPSMQNFFYICDYLDVTPEEFFAIENKKPELFRQITDNIKLLDDDELYHLHGLVNALAKKHKDNR